MIVGLDFDGIIVKSNMVKSLVAKKDYKFTVRASCFCRRVVVGAGLITNEQYDGLINDVYTNPAYFDLMEEIDGAFEYIRRLQGEGIELQVVTTKSEEGFANVESFMGTHLEGIVVTRVEVGESKAEAVGGFTAFVDDDLGKLVQMEGVVPHRFLMTHGYNRLDEVPLDIERINNGWPQIYREVHELMISKT